MICLYTKAPAEKGSATGSEKQPVRTHLVLLAFPALAKVPHFDIEEHLSFFLPMPFPLFHLLPTSPV